MKYSVDFWPDDVDGDVLRQMRKSGFDFEEPVDLDFNVDFETWPPSDEFVDMLRAQYPNLTVYEPDDEDDGYVLFVVNAVLTYELVMFVQSTVSEMADPFGGKCESWGVLH
ncbi:MAG: ribonuclease E inhibitor RraB [Pseudomonadota bacterium]